MLRSDRRTHRRGRLRPFSVSLAASGMSGSILFVGLDGGDDSPNRDGPRWRPSDPGVPHGCPKAAAKRFLHEQRQPICPARSSRPHRLRDDLGNRAEVVIVDSNVIFSMRASGAVLRPVICTLQSHRCAAVDRRVS